MTKNKEKDLGKEVFDQMITLNNIIGQGFDNLFSANHRQAMIRQHGGTQAQFIKLEDLI